MYTHLERLPLLLLHGADVAEVPLLRRGLQKDPRAQELVLYTQDAWLSPLSRLDQLLLEVTQPVEQGHSIHVCYTACATARYSRFYILSPNFEKFCVNDAHVVQINTVPLKSLLW